ncbi:MAG: DUF4307 domain-containing protein [Actinomycetota bacterium]|uniref:DUF4307 domain-containing protein n=1 Tax=Candidatus Planktophila sp. TaxID=2175601 RepID=UPI002A03C9D7|nr:DUF4307 domain-containing protein [Actinomycetota bacterium]
MDFDFNDRYGVRSTKGWVTPAIVFALIGGGWLIWAALHHSDPPIRSELISFEVTADREISIRYRIDRIDPNQVVICTLSARDQDKNVIGQIDETIAAGSTSSEQITAIPARSTPFTAAIVRCRAK